ncbi:hypothetical protein PIB30_017669 [Stylosanthes scabra]|uniref:Uncharacterized protein n=1 Tax=Stylosanthes scabra TaxID=79078 RepID=A0ABU6Y610_9FABA|nr:hypothetical protein [Stylosanthes scabra]
MSHLSSNEIEEFNVRTPQINWFFFSFLDAVVGFDRYSNYKSLYSCALCSLFGFSLSLKLKETVAVAVGFSILAGDEGFGRSFCGILQTADFLNMPQFTVHSMDSQLRCENRMGKSICFVDLDLGIRVLLLVVSFCRSSFVELDLGGNKSYQKGMIAF